MGCLRSTLAPGKRNGNADCLQVGGWGEEDRNRGQVILLRCRCYTVRPRLSEQLGTHYNVFGL